MCAHGLCEPVARRDKMDSDGTSDLRPSDIALRANVNLLVGTTSRPADRLELLSCAFGVRLWLGAIGRTCDK